MAWNTAITYVATSPVNAALLNGIGNDLRVWGADVDGGGYGLSNLRSIGGAAGDLSLTVGAGGKLILNLAAQPGVVLNGTAAIAPTLRLTDYTAQYFSIQIGAVTYNDGTFSVYNGAHRLVVSKTGQVGIGTPAPTSQLSVIDSPRAPSLIPTAPAIAIFDDTNMQLAIGGMGSAPYGVWMQARHGIGGGSQAYSLLLQPLGGYVGIGTTAPKAPLHVVGLVTYASNAAALAASLTAGAFYTDGAGNVKVVF